MYSVLRMAIITLTIVGCLITVVSTLDDIPYARLTNVINLKTRTNMRTLLKDGSDGTRSYCYYILCYYLRRNEDLNRPNHYQKIHSSTNDKRIFVELVLPITEVNLVFDFLSLLLMYQSIQQYFAPAPAELLQEALSIDLVSSI